MNWKAAFVWVARFRLEALAAAGIGLISYGAALIYEPLPWFFVGSVLLFISIQGARRDL